MFARLRAWAGWWYVGLVGVTGLSAVLRVWQLGRQDLWLDELFTVSVTSSGVAGALAGMASDTSPPLYFVIQSLITPMLGRTEFALRLFPVATSVLATLVIALLGARVYGRVVGFAAGLLFAVAPYSVEYAQEARMYSLMMLCVALALLAFAALLEKPDRLRATLLGVALAGLLYTHVYGYMAVLAFAVPVTVLPRLRARIGRPLVLSYGVAGLLFLPWMLVIPGQVSSVLESSSAGSWWGAPVEQVVTEFVDRVMRLAPSEGLIVSLLFVVLLLLGLPFHTRGHVCDDGAVQRLGGVDEDDFTWTVIAVSLLPVFVGLAISKYIAVIATHRNTLVALPGACLMVARGAARMRRGWMTGVLGILIVASLLALPDYYASDEKGGWREATSYVHESGLTAAVIVESYEGGLQYTTYSDLLGRADLPPAMKAEDPDEGASEPELGRWDTDTDVLISDFLRSHDKVVVILPKGEPGPAEEYLNEQDEWRAIDTLDLSDPVVKIWERK